MSVAMRTNGLWACERRFMGSVVCRRASHRSPSCSGSPSQARWSTRFGRSPTKVKSVGSQPGHDDVGAALERRLQEVTLWLRDASDKLNQRLDARLQATEGHILARFSDLEGRIDSLDAKLEGRFGNVDTRLDNAAKMPLQVWSLAISIAALVLGLLGKLSLFPGCKVQPDVASPEAATALAGRGCLRPPVPRQGRPGRDLWPEGRVMSRCRGRGPGGPDRPCPHATMTLRRPRPAVPARGRGAAR